MITIIHGDDIAASRTFFSTIKEKTKDPVTVDGKKITPTELTQLLEGNGLFVEHTTLFIEDFFANKKSKTMDEMVGLLESSTTSNIYFWEGKLLPKKDLGLFPKADNKQFSLPQLLFTFLDNIRPQNQKLVSLFHALLETMAPELVLFMLVRQFRLLLAVSDEGTKAIDEIARIAPWQKSKIRKQAVLFSLPSLISHYKKLCELDVVTKTGANPLSLTQSIDFFLLEL